MHLRRPALYFLVLALATLLVFPAGAAPMTLEQVELTPIPQLANQVIGGINPDGQGNLIVSHEWGHIWKVNPLTGAYTYYDLGVGYLTDAHWDGTGRRYWLTDGVNQISYANPTLSRTYTWKYDTGAAEEYKLAALAVETPNRIWLADYFGATSKIYLFKFSPPTGGEMCPLVGDYTTRAYDLILHNGSLWYYNWSEEKISRLTLAPDGQGKYALTTWLVGLPTQAVEGRVLVFDAEGKLWIPGGDAGTIMSFDPDTGGLMTYTVPTGSPSIEGVTVVGSQIAYADHLGSVGLLDPEIASGTPKDLSDAMATVLLEEQCDTKLTYDGSEPFYETQSDVLQFSQRESVPDTGHPGWTIYPPGSSDELYGIHSAQGAVLISDSRLDNPPLRSNWLLRLSSQTRLIVNKTIQNDNGGAATPVDFAFRVNGGDLIHFEPGGQVILPVNPGAYTVAEESAVGYQTTYLNCTDIIISEGETETCTITNDDVPPRLKLVKNVVNDDGGTGIPQDWMLTAAGEGGFSDVGDSDVFHDVKAGVQYTLGESAISGYIFSGWSCTGGEFTPPNKIKLSPGAQATCTATNDDLPQGGFFLYLPLITR